MHKLSRILAWGLAWCIYSASASAVVLGATDTFEDGSTNGWSSGAANPSPPVNVSSGGPAGVGDHYLAASASGSGGAGGKLVLIAGAQWTGDYLAAGVSALTLDARNYGSTDLSLRLALFGVASTIAVSADAIPLAAHRGWTHLRFSLDPLVLSGPGPAVLEEVSELRLFHGTQAAFPGENIAAQVGIDNVSAVPEPAPALLLACGLAAALGWRSWAKRS